MKKLIPIIIMVAILIAAGAFTVYDNFRVVVTEYDYKSNNISSDLDGFKIVQVTDLHNRKFFDGCDTLIETIRSCEPDIIVMTGDIVEHRADDITPALDFIRRASEIADVYFLRGNHEELLTDEKHTELMKTLVECGVVLLDQEKTVLNVGESSIGIYGILAPHTPSFIDGKTEEDDFSLGLLHYTENAHNIFDKGLDLILSGHTHGGQARFFDIGLYAPNQGFLPEYDYGEFKKNDTVMFVSSGLAGSFIPIRINNPPEIVLITLDNPNIR